MKQINGHELKGILNGSPVVKVIDVREGYEVASGKIPGAIHIPLGQLTASLGKLSKDMTYALICQSGYRSQMAAQFMAQQGYDVMNVRGGMSAWPGELE